MYRTPDVLCAVVFGFQLQRGLSPNPGYHVLCMKVSPQSKLIRAVPIVHIVLVSVRERIYASGTAVR